MTRAHMLPIGSSGSRWLWHLRPQVHAARTGSVIVPANLIAGRGADGERREPGPGDPGAVDVLDMDPRPEIGACPGSSSGPDPASGHARKRRGEAGLCSPCRKAAGGAAARSVRLPVPHHAE